MVEVPGASEAAAAAVCRHRSAPATRPADRKSGEVMSLRTSSAL